MTLHGQDLRFPILQHSLVNKSSSCESFHWLTLISHSVHHCPICVCSFLLSILTLLFCCNVSVGVLTVVSFGFLGGVFCFWVGIFFFHLVRFGQAPWCSLRWTNENSSLLSNGCFIFYLETIHTNSPSLRLHVAPEDMHRLHFCLYSPYLGENH